MKHTTVPSDSDVVLIDGDKISMRGFRSNGTIFVAKPVMLTQLRFCLTHS